MPVIAVASVLEAVTVHAQGAICTRRAQLPLEGGRLPEQVRLTGLPLSLQGGSLRARVLLGPEGLRVHDVRASFEAELPPELDVPAEQRALEEAQDALSSLEKRLALVDRDLQALGQLRPSYPQPRRGEPPREAPVSELLALADFTGAELQRLHGTRRELVRQLEDARNAVELCRHRLAESSTARRTERTRLTRAAVVSLVLPHEHGPAELGIEYLVPGARWVPSYSLRLSRAMDSGELRMRAAVAQETGEDWTGVRLSLSTAGLDRRAEVPELRSLRIGRAQPPPPRSGWREPPPGLDELFAGYDATAGRRPRPAPAPPAGLPKAARPAPAPEPRKEADADSLVAVRANAMPRRAPMAPPPMPSAMPPAPASAPAMAMQALDEGGGPPMEMEAEEMAVPAMAPARTSAPGRFSFGGGAPAPAAKRKSARSRDTGEMAKAVAAVAEGAPPEGDDLASVELGATLLDYDRLVLAGPGEAGSRGRLRPAGALEQELLLVAGASVQVDVLVSLVTRQRKRAAAVESLALPGHATPVRRSAGSYDYRFDTEHPVDVASDGAWHVVPVMAAEVSLAPEYVCVPSLESKVYRTVVMTNRSPHALLAGPLDVTLGDEFLMTVPLPTIPPLGEERVGMGVEEAIQVARNTRFKETTGGLLGGSAVLQHEIEVQVSNQLSRPATLEVRERVPISTDGDIKVEETASSPPWKKDVKLHGGVQAEGARVWRLTVPAGEKATLGAQYIVKLPGDKMLVGGNRRV